MWPFKKKIPVKIGQIRVKRENPFETTKARVLDIKGGYTKIEYIMIENKPISKYNRTPSAYKTKYVKEWFPEVENE